jgi:hypothetical protein
MKDAKFKNGDIVRDNVSGYTGMVVATTLWLNGCYRYVVASQTVNEAGVPTDHPFDELQLTKVADSTIEGKHETGGPRPGVTQGKVAR